MEAKTLDSLEFPKILALIAGFAGSNAAKDAVAKTMPMTDAKLIKDALDEMEELADFINRGGRLPIGGIREMRDIIITLQKGSETLSGEDLLRVRADIEVGNALKKAFFGEAKIRTVEENKRLGLRIKNIPQLASINEAIGNSINDKGEVRDHATPRLASIRRELVQARQEIERRLSDLVNSSTDIYQDRFFTLRGDRYVVPVKAASQSLIQGIVHDQSGSGQTVFMEPLEFLGLNNRLVRLKSEEREEVIRILKALTDQLADSLNELRSLFDTLVALDLLNAKTRFAAKYDANRPIISTDGGLILKNARHPLIHPDCVPVEIEMNKSQACIIITGPNGGGKTVALKIVGINALLLQSGNFILASANSTLPVFQNILADIGESQSIEDHLSTFTSHLQRLKEILTFAQAPTLVLLDEIGTGTDPTEGAALAKGVLKELTRRGVLSLVTSHLEGLKHAAFTTPGFVNAGMEFDYTTFRPTFRFQMGIPGRSNALSIARIFGIPEEVLTDLADCAKGKAGEERNLIAAMEIEHSKAEALRRSLEKREASISLKEVEVDADLARLKEFRRKKRDEMTETYESQIRRKIREFEQLIHLLKDKIARLPAQESQADLAEARKGMQEARNTLTDLENLNLPDVTPQTRSERNLEIGDSVFLGESPYPGILRDLDENREKGVVEFDGKWFHTPISQLRYAGLKKTAETSFTHVGSAPFVRDELDLRGMRVEEALEKCESYLKLAQAQKLGKVFLIHGKGTGALQRAVHEFLKQGPFRKKFRFGRYGEGDLGVTVVVFDPAADAESAEKDDARKNVRASKRPEKRKK